MYMVINLYNILKLTYCLERVYNDWICKFNMGMGGGRCLWHSPELPQRPDPIVSISGRCFWHLNDAGVATDNRYASRGKRSGLDAVNNPVGTLINARRANLGKPLCEISVWELGLACECSRWGRRIWGWIVALKTPNVAALDYSKPSV